MVWVLNVLGRQCFRIVDETSYVKPDDATTFGFDDESYA